MTPESIIDTSREGFLLTEAGLLTGIFIVSAVLLIGFLLKNVINFWMAGMMFKMLKPFRVGDTISTAGATGVVESMGLLTTVLATSDNTTVFLPNHEMLQTGIFNHSVKGARRNAIGCTILSDEDIEAARDIIEEVLGKDSRILADPSPDVQVVNYCDEGAVLLAQFWTSSIDCVRIRTDAMVSMLRLFRGEEIRIRCFRDQTACCSQASK